MYWCPSGLRGTTQVRMAKASWVQIPLSTIIVKKYYNCTKFYINTLIIFYIIIIILYKI